MSVTELPHAEALARELDVEVRRLDVLQHAYIQELVDQLVDVSFLASEEGGQSPLQSSWSCKPVPCCCGFATCDAGGHQKSNSHATMNDGSVACHCAAARPSPPIEGTRNLSRTARQSIPRQRLVSEPKRRNTTLNEIQRSQPMSSSSQVPRAALPPPPQRSRRDEEARRARRALRCIREDRDAHFNAKTRRAQELLSEGRRAVLKSRERRLAEASAALKRQEKKKKGKEERAAVNM